MDADDLEPIPEYPPDRFFGPLDTTPERRVVLAQSVDLAVPGAWKAFI